MFRFQKIYGKHLCQSLFLNKVAGLRLATLLKKKLCHRCFPVNFPKFLRTPFLQNTSERVFLRMITLNAISSLLEIFLSSYFSNFLFSVLKLNVTRSSRPEVFCKKVFLVILQNLQENTCAKDSFLIKLACNFYKKESLAQVFPLAQVFFCDFCKISKNTFFYRTPPLAATA